MSAETKADRASILIVDEATQGMKVRAAVGLRREAIEAEERIEQHSKRALPSRTKFWLP